MFIINLAQNKGREGSGPAASFSFSSNLHFGLGAAGVQNRGRGPLVGALNCSQIRHRIEKRKEKQKVMRRIGKKYGTRREIIEEVEN